MNKHYPDVLAPKLPRLPAVKNDSPESKMSLLERHFHQLCPEHKFIIEPHSNLPEQAPEILGKYGSEY